MAVGIAAALLTASFVVPGSASAVGEGPPAVIIPPYYFQFDSSFAPKRVGRRTPTPIGLSLMGASNGVGLPLEIRSLTLEFDRHMFLNAEELPTCNPMAFGHNVCRRALIGEGIGDTVLESDDPGEAIRPEANLALYNGGIRGDAAVIYLELRLPAPWGEAVYRTVRIRAIDQAPFGSRATIAIPPILEGRGHLTSFEIKIDDELRVDGDETPVLTATCPTGKLAIRGVAEFVGSVEPSATESVRACTPTSAG